MSVEHYFVAALLVLLPFTAMVIQLFRGKYD